MPGAEPYRALMTGSSQDFARTNLPEITLGIDMPGREVIYPSLCLAWWPAHYCGNPTPNSSLQSTGPRSTSRRKPDKRELHSLIVEFKHSAEFETLKPASRRNYLAYLRLIENESGDMPVEPLADPEVRASSNDGGTDLRRPHARPTTHGLRWRACVRSQMTVGGFQSRRAPLRRRSHRPHLAR